MPFQKSYTDEQLLQAVKNSSFMSDAIRKLGLTNGCFKSFKKHLARLKLDTSHWVNPHTLKISNLKNIKEIPLKDILVENSSYIYSSLKEKLIKEKLFVYKCSICSIDTWNNKNIVLQLDHINGVHNDNRLENLRLLCPNCHSQTDTFCGKLKKQNLPKCKYCDNSVRDKRAKTCQACYLSGDFSKLNWPSNNKLIELLNLYTYKEVSKMLSINETTIRNRIYGKRLSKLIKRCKISNYAKLKQIIEKYLPIVEENSKEQHRFMETDMKIYLSTNGYSDEKLFVYLTHEFGHYLSFKKNEEEFRHSLNAWNAYKNYKKIPTDHEKKLIIEEEENAWKYGEDFIKQNGFDINYYFDSIKKNSLTTYNNARY